MLLLEGGLGTPLRMWKTLIHKDCEKLYYQSVNFDKTSHNESEFFVNNLKMFRWIHIYQFLAYLVMNNMTIGNEKWIVLIRIFNAYTYEVIAWQKGGKKLDLFVELNRLPSDKLVCVDMGGENVRKKN